MSIKIFKNPYLEKASKHDFYIEDKREDRSFFVLAKSNSENIVKIKTGMEAIINQRFLLSEDVLDTAVENTLKDLNNLLKNQLSNKEAEETLRLGGVVLAFIEGKELRISAFGTSEAFLLRDAVVTEISEGLSPNNIKDDYFENISSGTLQNGDKLLFSTIRVQRTITERQLRDFLSDGIMEAQEAITSLLDKDEGGALVFIHIKSIETASFLDKVEGRERTTYNVNSFFHNFKHRLPFALEKKHVFLMLASFLAIFLIVVFFKAFTGEDPVVAEQNNQYEEFIKSVVPGKIQFIEQNINNEENRAAVNMNLNELEKKAKEMQEVRSYIQDSQIILEKVEKYRMEINRVMQIENPSIKSQLRDLKDDISAKGMIYYKDDDAFYIFDKNNLYRLLSADDEISDMGTILNDDSDEVILAIPFENKNKIIFFTKRGVLREWEDGSIMSMDTADSTWKKPVDIDTWSKNVYFLDPASNQIWKYERRDTSFTVAEPWLAEEVDLTDALSFAIDGSVYVLKKNGEVIELLSGVKQDWAIQNCPFDINADQIYTDENLAYVFLLDKDERSITTIDKESGNYKNKIIFKETESIIDFYVNSEKKIFLLGEQNVYIYSADNEL